MEESILEFIGSDLIGVITPVSICMLLVVLLVSTLYSSSSTPQTQLITAANLVYAESVTDTTAHKLTGALENAAVFILLIAVATFILVLLYYYNFTRFLKYYMRFSTFVILFTMGGGIFVSLIRHFDVGVDLVTFSGFMVNFAGVGVVAVFGGGGVPIVVTQGYTVVLGIITAAWFTQLPEWTTWVLLLALAVYDLVAVLAPGGPLKILVELAQSRDDELPALVYEARPRVRVRVPRGEGNVGVEMPNLVRNDGGRDVEGGRERESERVGLVSNVENSTEIHVVDEARPRARVSRAERGGEGGIGGLGMFGVSDNVGVEMQNLGRNDRVSDNGGSEVDGESGRREREGESVALISNVESTSEIVVVNQARSPDMDDDDDDDDSETTIRGIKLGLGDFVFYSVLVGRAAMYDLMTVYACYLAIISGLACTLILLSVWRRALPALPISIALGIAFYFLTRLLMEPFVVQTSTNLLMF